jgi:cytosine deaminase
MANFDILIRNSQLRGQPENRYEIGISGTEIAALSENLSGDAQTVIDAQGSLVTEAFVNPHLHLCKVYTLPMMDELALQDYHGADMGKAMTAIELAARIKESYDESWIIKNVRKAVAHSAIFGGTHIRAFADVDNKAKLIGVKALIRAREEFKDIVTI